MGGRCKPKRHRESKKKNNVWQARPLTKLFEDSQKKKLVTNLISEHSVYIESFKPGSY